MENKGRALTILGTTSLFAGLLLLLGVLFIWLVPPPMPTNEEFQASGGQDTAQTALSAGPALSPYYPAATAVPNRNIAPTSPNEANPAAQTEQQDQPEGAGQPQYPRDMGNHAPDRHSQSSAAGMMMIIPVLDVQAPVLPVSLYTTEEDGRPARQWQVPDQYAAGWHMNSAPPGQPGNTVLNGHNNIHGAIFRNLVDLPLGAEIILNDGGQSFHYQVTGREFLLEQGEPLRDRQRNARWIMPTDDERITIVTCWPNSSNSHRLVVIAHPVDRT